MKALTLKELDVSPGDILVCESNDSTLFTYGIEYTVEREPLTGKFGIMTDCGFIATTTVALFIKTHEVVPVKVEETPPKQLSSWPVHNVSTECVTDKEEFGTDSSAVEFYKEHPTHPVLNIQNDHVTSITI
jgi:hypothetical protein